MLKYLLIIACLMVLTGCTTVAVADASPADERLNVAATIFPLYDFARAVGGEEIKLTKLISPGMDIHAFDPSPADIINIQNADVFIYIGGESESWADSLLDAIDTDIKIIRLIEYICVLCSHGSHHHDNHDHHHHNSVDEHIWTSPYNATLMIQAIADILAKADYKNSGYYRLNAQLYINEILELDAAFEALAQAAEDTKIIVGDRFPFGYFVERYGFTYYAAFEGCGVGLDPSPAVITHLIDVVRERSIQYVFHIEMSSQNITDIITNETGAVPLLLHSVHNVSYEEWQAGETYLSLMQKNLENLRRRFNQP